MSGFKHDIDEFEEHHISLCTRDEPQCPRSYVCDTVMDRCTTCDVACSSHTNRTHLPQESCDKFCASDAQPATGTHLHVLLAKLPDDTMFFVCPF